MRRINLEEIKVGDVLLISYNMNTFSGHYSSFINHNSYQWLVKCTDLRRGTISGRFYTHLSTNTFSVQETWRDTFIMHSRGVWYYLLKRP